MDPSQFTSPVESQAASMIHLMTALIFLSLTLVGILILMTKLLRSKSGNYSFFEPPYSYIGTIYTGILLIIINELIILGSIIITEQQMTYFGREKSIFIIIGLGFFIYGWTRLLLFNLSLSPTISKIVGMAFLGAMLFYTFAVIITILVTFGLINTSTFLGIGYSTAVLIYGSFLVIDLIAVTIVAIQKRKQSKYQAWMGLLLFSALFLNFISIIFNVIPLVIVGNVDPQIHVIFNYIVEPTSYFITSVLSLLFLYWVLFNPEWLTRRSIEQGS